MTNPGGQTSALEDSEAWLRKLLEASGMYKFDTLLFKRFSAVPMEESAGIPGHEEDLETSDRKGFNLLGASSFFDKLGPTDFDLTRAQDEIRSFGSELLEDLLRVPKTERVKLSKTPIA